MEYQGSGTCGDNAHPNKQCLNQPRLAALDTSNGHVDASWRPQICCMYNGVWMLLVDGGHLHVGGEFTKAGGRESAVLRAILLSGSSPRGSAVARLNAMS